MNYFTNSARDFFLAEDQFREEFPRENFSVIEVATSITEQGEVDLVLLTDMDIEPAELNF